MKRLKACVVGLKMGRAHVQAYFQSECFDLVAICDLDTALAEATAKEVGNPKVYAYYDEMLANEKPDVVTVATPNNLHESMTIKAAEMGVKGIYCEKPVATNLGEARNMQKVCDEKGAKLVVGHQRRMSNPYVTMKRLVDSGAIGDVYLVRGLCAGDCLSDGTHTVDSILSIFDGKVPATVLGQVNYEPNKADESGQSGMRYGHPVESGAMAVIDFEYGDGEIPLRVEIFTGDMKVNHWDAPYPGWAYQDIEILGSKGRIWRNGDSADPAVALWDAEAGAWRACELVDVDGGNVFLHVYNEFYEYVVNNKPHPMRIENAIRTQEVVMGIYESARVGKKLSFPILQEEFPLVPLLKERGMI